MNIRQIRENWDSWLLFTLIVFILCWALLTTAVVVFGQTAPRAILVWDAIPDTRALGYRIKKGITPTALADVGNTQQPTTTWQDDLIDPLTPYYYNVRGYDSIQDGEQSPILSFRFSDIQPGQATSLIVVKYPSPTPGRIALKASWAAPTQTRSLLTFPAGTVLSYNVFVTSNGVTQKYSTAVNTLMVPDLKKNLTVYFYVTVVLNGIEGLGSVSIRVQT